jgi:hypothetical protein
MTFPLMPKSIAVWLVDNTALSFDQIAEFCGLHPLEVQGIADGEVAQNLVGQDPIKSGQLTREEIERCTADPTARLKLKKTDMPAPQVRRGPRYTPVSRRQDRPDAIAWLLRNHPELTEAQISKLIGTTKPTIVAIRERTHWNSSNIKPTDPVALGLCKQIELDEAIAKAAARMKKKEAAAPKAADKATPAVENPFDTPEPVPEPTEETAPDTPPTS